MQPTVVELFDLIEGMIQKDIDASDQTMMHAYLFNPEDKCSIVVMPDLDGHQAAVMTRVQCYEDKTEIVALYNGIWIARLDTVPEPWLTKLRHHEIEVRELPEEYRSDGWMVYVETPDEEFVIRQYELDDASALVMHSESTRTGGDFHTHFYPLLTPNLVALAKQGAKERGIPVPDDAEEIMGRTLVASMTMLKDTMHRIHAGTFQRHADGMFREKD